MKKLQYLLLVILLFVFSCKTRNKKTNYNYEVLSSKYFSLINKAEVLIVCDSLEKSKKYYNAAFELTDRVFAKDVYNYMILSIKLGNIGDSKKAIEYLISKKGISLNYLRKRKEFYDLRNNKILWAYTVNSYPKLHSSFVQTADLKLRDSLKSIFERDQYIRDSIPKGVNQYLHPAILKTDSINMIKVFNIFDKYGYPTIDMTGINEKDGFLNDYLNVVILHNFADLRFDSKLISFLRENSQVLKIHPNQLFRWMYTYYLKNSTFFNTLPPGGFYITIIDGVSYYRKLNIEERKTIDSLRNAYYLDSYKEEGCKAFYQWEHREFYFSKTNVVKYNMKYPEQGKYIIRDFKLKPIDGLCPCYKNDTLK